MLKKWTDLQGIQQKLYVENMNTKKVFFFKFLKNVKISLQHFCFRNQNSNKRDSVTNI